MLKKIFSIREQYDEKKIEEIIQKIKENELPKINSFKIEASIDLSKIVNRIYENTREIEMLKESMFSLVEQINSLNEEIFNALNIIRIYLNGTMSRMGLNEKII